MRPDYLYFLVAVAIVSLLLVRRLRSGRTSPTNAAILSAAVAPAAVSLVPVPLLPELLLFGAAAYMIVREVVDSATHPADPRR